MDLLPTCPQVRDWDNCRVQQQPFPYMVEFYIGGVVLSGFLRLARDYILCHLLDKTIPKCYPAEKKQPCAPSQELEGSEELTCRTQYVLWSDGVELLLPPFGLRKGENKKGESSALLKPLYLIQRRKLSSCISPVSLGPQSRGRLLNIF